MDDIEKLMWEVIEKKSSNYQYKNRYIDYYRTVERAKVFGGWLVRSRELSTESDSEAYVVNGAAAGSMGKSKGVGVGITFIPDQNHEWRI